MGIKIYHGYHLHEIIKEEETKTCDKVVIRKNSENYEEILS